jgi:hypothetical protein
MEYSYSCSEYSCSSIETFTTTSTDKWDEKICSKSLDNYIKSFNDYIGNNYLMQFLKGKDNCSLDYYSDKWEDCNIWKMSLGIYILSVFKYYNIYDENIVNCLLDCHNVDRFCNIMYFLDDKKDELKKYLNINENKKDKFDYEKCNNLDNNKKDILDNYLEIEASSFLSPQNNINNSNIQENINNDVNELSSSLNENKSNLENIINILNVKYKKDSVSKYFIQPKKVTLGNAYMTAYKNRIRKINSKKEELEFINNANKLCNRFFKKLYKKDIRNRKTNKDGWDLYFKKEIEIKIYKEENQLHKICNKTLETQYNCYRGLINIGKYIIDNNISAKTLHEEIFDNFIDKYNITGTIFNNDKNNNRFRIKCIRLYNLTKYIKIQDLIKLKIIKKITDMDEELFLYVLDKFKNVKIKYI